MGTFDQFQSTAVREIVAEVVAADRGAGENLGGFDIAQDVAGRFVGNSSNFSLSSVFQPIFSVDTTEILGHAAYLRSAHVEDQKTREKMFAAIDSNGALVRFDRLCRALHLLNYFHRALPGWQLWLRVETRLLATVKQDHGAVFRRILERYCGLSTSRVVIEFPVEAAQEPPVLAVALANYRAHGYRTAINYHSQIPRDVLKFADFVHVNAVLDQPTLKQAVDEAHSGGATAIVKKIESESLCAAAVEAGAEGLQGYFLAMPVFALTSSDQVRGHFTNIETGNIARGHCFANE